MPENSFELSTFGYWITEKGGIHPLAEPMSHASVLKRLNGDSALPDEALIKHAVEELRWIRVGIGPNGQSYVVQCIEHGLERETISGLRKVLIAHDWLQGDLYTDLRIEPFKFADLNALLRDGCVNSTMYPNVLEELAAIRRELSQVRAELRAANSLAKAACETAGIDHQKLTSITATIRSMVNMSERDIKTFFAKANQATSVKNVIDQAHYYIGHEVGRHLWYVRTHLADELPKAFRRKSADKS